MPAIAPLTESEATDKIEQTYGRINEMLGTDSVPDPFLLYGRVPAFLQDFFMNSKRFVFSDGKLPAKTKGLIALAVASKERSSIWADWLTEYCHKLGWSDTETTDVRAVAGACAMYNTFFKFRDLAGRDIFQGMSVGLRAHTFAGTSLDELTVELVNVVISDLNSCHACVSGHVAKAVELGASEEAILEAIQCAATMMAGTTFHTAAGY
ncbi:carboxymuconolactone decarboxylase family protein [bacterium]|jgi:lipoyl-dependent peroxiredoxin subunit D|nr:carboxymuconolactone decarboxylase family protein [bacterium]